MLYRRRGYRSTTKWAPGYTAAEAPIIGYTASEAPIIGDAKTAYTIILNDPPIIHVESARPAAAAATRTKQTECCNRRLTQNKNNAAKRKTGYP